MIRISDILKKAKEPKRPEGNSPLKMPLEASQRAFTQATVKPVEPEAQERSPEIRKESRKKEGTAPEDISLSSILNKPVSKEEGEALYQEMMLLAQELLVQENKYIAGQTSKMVTLIERAVEQVMVGNEKLLMSAFLKDSFDTNLQFCHAVNVCIFAVEIGLELKYSRLNVMELGVLAFLHDSPMAKYLLLASMEVMPQDAPREESQEYAAAILQIFSYIDGLCNLPGDIIRHDSKISLGIEHFISLKAEDFSRYAKIIAVVDFYETVTHRGIYGDRRSSLEAVQEILNNKDKYEQGVIKVLIDKIGIFPVGCIIRLSTREVAQVIKLNKGKPLRPIIKILHDTEGKKLQAEKILDLSMHPTIYIKEEEKEINKK